jgi:hypothetical protein
MGLRGYGLRDVEEREEKAEGRRVRNIYNFGFES